MTFNSEQYLLEQIRGKDETILKLRERLARYEFTAEEMEGLLRIRTEEQVQ